MPTFQRYKRELAAGLALLVLLAVVSLVAPSFFTTANLGDLALNNAPLLLVATGMTLVILVGQIDISVGSQFAVVSVAVGLLAKAGVPVLFLFPSALVLGVSLGAVNGRLVGRQGLPTNIVTHAMLVAWRDALRWSTQGAWVQDRPGGFPWLGLGQTAGRCSIVAVALGTLGGLAWALRNLGAGRAVYAVGSDREAARLAGIEPGPVVFWVFVSMGAMKGVAAFLNAIRFSAIPSNKGVDLELKAVAPVDEGRTAIRGGRGTNVGTQVVASQLVNMGPALTFAGINPFWEKAVQGTIILAALGSDKLLVRLESHVRPAR
jgi:rhamnose transport system permease protein